MSRARAAPQRARQAVTGQAVADLCGWVGERRKELAQAVWNARFDGPWTAVRQETPRQDGEGDSEYLTRTAAEAYRRIGEGGLPFGDVGAELVARLERLDRFDADLARVRTLAQLPRFREKWARAQESFPRGLPETDTTLGDWLTTRMHIADDLATSILAGDLPRDRERALIRTLATIAESTEANVRTALRAPDVAALADSGIGEGSRHAAHAVVGTLFGVPGSRVRDAVQRSRERGRQEAAARSPKKP